MSVNKEPQEVESDKVSETENEEEFLIQKIKQ